MTQEEIEKKALEAYPNVPFPGTPFDINAYRREAYIKCWEDNFANQPQLQANLDEAAKDAQEDLYDGFYSGHIAAYQEAFKRGARWMAEQGYSEKTYVYANRFNDENEAVIQLGWGEPERGGFKPGDKVIVQIRKAE